MALQAKLEGLTALILPIENVKEASIIEGIAIYGFSQLKEVVQFLKTGVSLRNQTTHSAFAHLTNLSKAIEQPLPKLEDIKGQAHCKRALERADPSGFDTAKAPDRHTPHTRIAKTPPGRKSSARRGQISARKGERCRVISRRGVPQFWGQMCPHFMKPQCIWSKVTVFGCGMQTGVNISIVITTCRMSATVIPMSSQPSPHRPHS